MKEKNNKGVIVLIVILILLVLGLSGYIVYDKVLSNNKSSNNNDVTTTTTTATVTENNITDSKYFKVDEFDYELNGKTIKIGFNYYLLKNEDGWTDEKVKSMIDDNIDGYYYNSIEVDVSINENIVKDLNKTIGYDIYNDIDDIKNNISFLTLEDTIKTIKGIDKDYIIVSINDKHPYMDGNISPFILNDNGKVIYAFDFPDATGWGSNDENAKLYGKGIYLIESDKIYYSLPDCDVPRVADENYTETIVEYSLTFNKDEAIIETLGSYTGYSAGGIYCEDRH